MTDRIKNIENKLFDILVGDYEYDLGETEDILYAMHDDDPDSFDIAFERALKRAREIAN